ncbi:MAG: hypothetical protein LBH25_00975, partial [Fibromonadaceae bacterium]|nr:hypothetical protein [Fibromonadaceae bacterium]
MKKVVSAVVCIALIAGLFVMLNSSKNKKMAVLAESKNASMDVPVRLYTIGEQDLSRRVKINGVVYAKSQVTVLAEAAGQVKRFYKEVGDVVYQGTPLAFVDATIVSTQLETARANLENAKRDLER